MPAKASEPVSRSLGWTASGGVLLWQLLLLLSPLCWVTLTLTLTQTQTPTPTLTLALTLALILTLTLTKASEPVSRSLGWTASGCVLLWQLLLLLSPLCWVTLTLTLTPTLTQTLP